MLRAQRLIAALLLAVFVVFGVLGITNALNDGDEVIVGPSNPIVVQEEEIWYNDEGTPIAIFETEGEFIIETPSAQDQK